MNLTQCHSKINDSTGNYLEFNHCIVEDDKSENNEDVKPNLLKKEYSSKSRKKSRSSYMCRKCRAHGQLLPVKNHRRNCPFKLCPCPLCTVVSHGREIVARQIRLYRNQKDISKRSPQSPHCRRCRNHGEHNAWKGHKKKCRHSNCPCKLCLLITMRKTNEKSYREIVQETHEEKSILVNSNNNSNNNNNNSSAFCLSNRSKDRSLAEDQSVFLRNINRTPILPTTGSNIYDTSHSSSLYAQNSMLNFSNSENCNIRPLNWSTASAYKVGLQPWDTNGSFDIHNNASYCGSSHLNNMMIGGHNVSQHNSVEYLPTATPSWYSNFY
uniref:Dmd-1 splice form 1 n=1 Tax=Schmidtea mediterranea TaxID=79327 RepID=R4PJJ9_SCHMD|nr:Dmd-1 splice form 1 [Schmidtea mediterranea]